MTFALTTLAACGDKATATKCKLGEVHDCTCKNGQASLQACDVATGAWEACMCPDDGSAAGSGGASGSGTSGTGSSGTTGGAGAGGTGAGSGGSGGSDADAGPTDGDAATGDVDAAMAAPAYAGPCPATACPTDETCNTAGKYCAAECAMADGSDCPAPPDGTAVKTCTIPLGGKGACSLSCTVGMANQCPTGMTCTAGFLTNASCTWP